MKTLIVSGSYNKEWEIGDLKPLEKLTVLTQLDFLSTHVSDRKPIASFTERSLNVRIEPKECAREIAVEDCPLSSPPREVVEQGNEAILRHFDELEKRGAEKLLEARLLIVGQGGAGKTSLKRKLKNPKEPLKDPGKRGMG